MHVWKVAGAAYFQAARSRRASVSQEMAMTSSSSRPTLARTAIAAPAASRSEKSSPRKPRASRVTSPAMGCSASFVRVVARWAVSAKRSSRKRRAHLCPVVARPRSCARQLCVVWRPEVRQHRRRSRRRRARPLGQVLQREGAHSRPRLLPGQTLCAPHRFRAPRVELLGVLNRPWTRGP